MSQLTESQVWKSWHKVALGNLALFLPRKEKRKNKNPAATQTPSSLHAVKLLKAVSSERTSLPFWPQMGPERWGPLAEATRLGLQDPGGWGVAPNQSFRKDSSALLIFFFILLEYGWLTMLCYFQVYSKVIHLYTHKKMDTCIPEA